MSDILQTVLQTILIDMVNAQNRANIRSARLAKDYVGEHRKIDLLEFFDVPTAIIKSFDFELKFGLEMEEGKIGDKIKEQLPKDIDLSTLTETIERPLMAFRRHIEINYQSVSLTEDKFNKLMIDLWNDPNSPLFSVSERQVEVPAELVEEARNCIRTLKDNLKQLTDLNIYLDDDRSKPNLKSVLTASDLDIYDGDLLCTININAEIKGLKAGFIDNDGGEGEGPNRRIILAGG